MGPITMTPMMPLMTGLPPTADTANDSCCALKNGLIRYESTMEMALKMPKKHPKANSMRMKFLFLSILGIASLKGCRTMFPDSEGGVGGLLSCKKILGRKHKMARIVSTNISFQVLLRPSVMVSGLSTSGAKLWKNMPGIRMPMTRETLSTSERFWVTAPLVLAENQFAEILAWQFRMNGLPIPAITCPTITQAKLEFTSILKDTPMMPRLQPRAIPTRVP